MQCWTPEPPREGAGNRGRKVVSALTSWNHTCYYYYYYYRTVVVPSCSCGLTVPALQPYFPFSPTSLVVAPMQRPKKHRRDTSREASFDPVKSPFLRLSRVCIAGGRRVVRQTKYACMLLRSFRKTAVSLRIASSRRRSRSSRSTDAARPTCLLPATVAWRLAVIQRFSRLGMLHLFSKRDPTLDNTIILAHIFVLCRTVLVAGTPDLQTIDGMQTARPARCPELGHAASRTSGRILSGFPSLLLFLQLFTRKFGEMAHLWLQQSVGPANPMHCAKSSSRASPAPRQGKRDVLHRHIVLLPALSPPPIHTDAHTPLTKEVRQVSYHCLHTEVCLSHC